MTSVVMMTSTASRPDVDVVSDGTVTAAQHRAARHRPHTITVNIADTSDMIADTSDIIADTSDMIADTTVVT